MSFFTYALIAVLLLGAFTLGAISMRDHLTGHFWPVGRWCATCYSWERDFYAHIYWCHPTHADCTTPGPQLPTPVVDDDDDDHDYPLIDWRKANQEQWEAGKAPPSARREVRFDTDEEDSIRDQ